MKKRVLFINGHLNAGGGEKSLLDLLCHLDYQKFDVDLLLLEELGDYYSELPREVNVFLYSLNDAFGSFVNTIVRAVRKKDWFSLWFRIIWSVSRVFGKERLLLARDLFKSIKPQYDAIVAYRPGICTDLAAYVFYSDLRMSWWHHGEVIYTGKELEEVERSFMYMDHIVAVSKNTAEMVKEAFPKCENKVSVIPNMIDCKEIQKKSTDYLVETPSRGIEIVSVGRLSPEKNMGMCVLAGEELRKKGIPFHWYIIGDGNQREDIQSAIAQRNLEKHIELLGRLVNPYPYMKRANVLVHPSLVESQGITVLESMALGTPVVVVKSMGPMEYIDDGVNGYLVDSIPEDIVNAVCEAIQSHDDIAKNALESLKKFTDEEIVKLFTNILEKG